MKKLPELFYVRTVPHTGTYFVFDVIELIDKNEICFTGVDQGLLPEYVKFKVFKLMRKLIDKEMDYPAFIKKILNYYKMKNVKYIGLYEHLALPGTLAYEHNSTWIYDFEKAGYPGYPVRTIMPMRDFRKAILTIMIVSINNPVALEKHLAWLKTGYQFMAEHYLDPDYFIIPVDMMGQEPLENRANLLERLFNEFLKVNYDKDKLFEFAEKWKPAHSIFEKPDETFRINSESDILLKLRCNKDMQRLRGYHKGFDREVKKYVSNKKLMKMFDYFGYK